MSTTNCPWGLHCKFFTAGKCRNATHVAIYCKWGTSCIRAKTHECKYDHDGEPGEQNDRDVSKRVAQQLLYRRKLKVPTPDFWNIVDTLHRNGNDPNSIEQLLNDGSKN